MSECLPRFKAVPKAAFSPPEQRPTPTQHFESLTVQGSLAPPEYITLIDDIVTRGATLMGAANRLLEVFPNARISSFAAMRTISDPASFVNPYAPVIGKTVYRSDRDDTMRTF